MGLPLLGLAFFLLWTIVLYCAVSTAFISPPGDTAKSCCARSATMIEMLTAFALLTAYLSSFVDWYGQRREPDAPPPAT